MNAKNIVKEKQLSTKINTLAHYYNNFSKMSFFKLCMKKEVIVAVFLFELTLFHIFLDQQVTYFFVLYLFHKCYPMPSMINNHGHNILRIFYVLPNFRFTTSETKPDY